MILKAEILDDKAVKRTLTRIAHEIIEKNQGVEDLVLVGIKSRGVPLANRIAALIEKFEDVPVSIATVDITYYRDDLTEAYESPVLNKNNIEMDLKGKKVVLIDDVIYTGRTVRAAMDAVFDKGRAESIQLAVLVDRGHRELPIRADFVGKNIPTSKKENVKVHLAEIDGEDSVKIYDKE
ncbi:bifunctional pyr operon transcriptional regulator/uracil phosphoribosyltransferase PyrR [Oceanirhabdus seepicola]|uniref:Bifunctional protein PyrR n=1 Tax=Oceanirhabdus seepicola TaxID=2828781 RepID=A0A9J6PCV7_9CLOT|nr:bifunctional pyr operon transcriptional regulator/uracil phosphoribosyltransferase PyrR [Oceanirhabdus seepicola]MCM1992725.1 bifunctional pyr operon transcriptional regulator/uracil phosphoribosyltransferase PyrR [Oceanirhabdus seepicola]